jgi:hypothetical protein
MERGEREGERGAPAGTRALWGLHFLGNGTTHTSGLGDMSW